MPKPRRSRTDTKWRKVDTGVGNDDWQRQADEAAWRAVSGIHDAPYLGGIEPIPIPPELRAQLRELGQALAADPSAARADALLRAAHVAVYGQEAPAASVAPANKDQDEWWS